MNRRSEHHELIPAQQQKVDSLGGRAALPAARRGAEVRLDRERGKDVVRWLLEAPLAGQGLNVQGMAWRLFGSSRGISNVTLRLAASPQLQTKTTA